MAMTLDIPPSLEVLIRARAAAEGKDVNQLMCEVIQQRLHELDELDPATPPPKEAASESGLDPADDPTVPPGALTYGQWKKRFDRMIALFREHAADLPPDLDVDVSRDSIYR